MNVAELITTLQAIKNPQFLNVEVDGHSLLRVDATFEPGVCMLVTFDNDQQVQAAEAIVDKAYGEPQ